MMTQRLQFDPAGIFGSAGHRGRLLLVVALLAVLGAFVAAQQQRVRGLAVDAAVLATYDDNVYFAPDGEEYNSWMTSILPHIRYHREGGRLYFDVDYRGAGDIYLSFDRGAGGDQEYETGNFYSNYLRLDFGYDLTDRLLLRVRNNLDNTNRPDFLMVDEVVYGQFIQNDTDVEVTYRTSERFELSAGYGYSFTDYYRTDDSEAQDYINSRAQMFKLAGYYHFSGYTRATFNYYFADREFPDQPEMDYRDNMFTVGLDKQLNDQWRLEAEGGVQDRSLESQIWDSGANFCGRAEVFLERERSTAGIGFECGRSLAPNYSADFYMDYILRGKWDWKVTEKDRLRFELGSRWNDFERYPADWVDVGAGLRDDAYVYTQIGYARRLREHVLFEGNYQYMNRDSNNADFDFGRNLLQVGVRFELLR